MSLLIFDLDGTLVKLPINYDELRRRLYKEFGDEKVFTSIYSFLLSLTDDERVKAFEIIDEFELESIQNMYIDPKLNESFRIIEGVTKALVTLQGLKPASKVLEVLGLKDKFSIIVTREYSLNRTDQLMYVLEQAGVDKSRVVFIGDTENDHKASEAVGIRSIILGSTISNRKVDNLFTAVKLALEFLSMCPS
ncbi:MAG: HAD family hydrolase [Crenarchaeota archaeon]|nr:HAD family hydrolase [Thermoproteota archaeon]